MPHCVPVPLGAATGTTPHGVELLRYGLRADTGEVTLVDIAHETRFLGNDLQRRQLADAAAAVAVWSVGRIAAGLYGLHQTAPHTFPDCPPLGTSKKGLELRHLDIDVIREVIGFLRRDYQRAGLAEGVQDGALVSHAAAPEAVDVHTQHGLDLAGPDALKQLEHFRARIELFTGRHFLIHAVHGQPEPVGQLLERGPVLRQHLLRALPLLRAALAEVHEIRRNHPPLSGYTSGPPRTQLTTYAWEAYRKGAVKRYQVLEGSSVKYDWMCSARSKATSTGNTTEATASDLRPLILLSSPKVGAS